jgi:hypothetical protein
MASRAEVEAIMVRRCGPVMEVAGMAVTYTGSNIDLADPIGWGLRQLDYDSSINPTTGEVAAVTSADFDEFLDYVNLALLENISTNLDAVDTTLGPRSEKLDQLAGRVEGRLTRLLEKMRVEYGYGIGTAVLGTMTQEFAEHYSGSD